MGKELINAVRSPLSFRMPVPTPLGRRALVGLGGTGTLNQFEVHVRVGASSDYALRVRWFHLERYGGAACYLVIRPLSPNAFLSKLLIQFSLI